MLKRFKTKEGITITIEISVEGKVTYKFEETDEKVEITKEMISETEAIEPWLWFVISKDEERLEYNNNKTETRCHFSYSDQNDKLDTLTTDEDALDQVMANLEKEALREAIQALEPQQQELVMDVYFSGISMADVARRDDVHKSSVTKRMNRIIEQLSKRYKVF